jgi:hypothetical protein
VPQLPNGLRRSSKLHGGFHPRLKLQLPTSEVLSLLRLQDQMHPQ